MKKAFYAAVLVLCLILSACTANLTEQVIASQDNDVETVDTAMVSAAIPTKTPDAEPTPESEPSPPLAVAEDAGYMDVISAILVDPCILSEKDISGFDTNIGDSGYSTITTSGGLSMGVGDNIAAYGGRRGEWYDKQCIVVKFRLNNDDGICFNLCAHESGHIVLSMTSPEYPAVGLSTEEGMAYTYIGQTFHFEQGEWYYALFAVDMNAELRLAVWQEDASHNIAYYQTNLANDSRYKTGKDYVNREWNLQLTAYETDAVDMDIAGFWIVDYLGYVN